MEEARSPDSRSSVSIEQTAKGDPKVTVKVYAGDTTDQMIETADVALNVYAYVLEGLKEEGGD